MDIKDVRSVNVLERLDGEDRGVPVLVSDQREPCLEVIEDYMEDRADGEHVVLNQYITHDVLELEACEVHSIMARSDVSIRPVSVELARFRLSIVEFSPA